MSMTTPLQPIHKRNVNSLHHFVSLLAIWDRYFDNAPSAMNSKIHSDYVAIYYYCCIAQDQWTEFVCWKERCQLFSAKPLSGLCFNKKSQKHYVILCSLNDVFINNIRNARVRYFSLDWSSTHKCKTEKIWTNSEWLH